MKINFTMDITPEEMKALASAEVESQRIREGMRRDKKFDEELAEAEKRHEELAKRWNDEFEEYKKQVDREFEEYRKAVRKEFEEKTKEWGTL